MFLTMMLNVTMLSFSLLFLLALLPLAATADLEGHPIVGGYTVANRHDAMVKEAAQFAVTSLVAADAPPSYTGFTVKDAEKVKIGIVSAETQVVAGLNIRLTVVIRDAKKPHHCQGAFDVDIYNHFGTMSVTKWGKEHTCSEAKKIKKDFKKLRKQKKGSKHAVVEAEDANADKGEIEEDEKENS